MKRIVVDGSVLPAWRAGLPAQWLKVFVPAVDGRESSGRAYTVRWLDPSTRELALDFVLHGDGGAVSAWAARARAGDRFQISDPHPRSGFAIDPAITRYLLLGDETALPAIGAIVEALPPHASADVFVEVAHGDERQEFHAAAEVRVTWVARDAARPALRGLLEAVQALPAPAAGTLVWMAAESALVKRLRETALARWGVDGTRLYAAGYWKHGVGDHRDDEVAGLPLATPQP
jgi:NADPH-dependent ferric siderophore reductase